VKVFLFRPEGNIEETEAVGWEHTIYKDEENMVF
jgi:hypothetical protein